MGPGIDAQLAKFVSDFLTTRLADDKLKDTLTACLAPNNCSGVVSARVNPEISVNVVGSDEVKVDVHINGMPISFTVYTASSVSIISEETYRKHFKSVSLRDSQRSRVGSLTDKAIKWSSAATRHWRTCPTSITWVAGYKATGATTQMCVIASRFVQSAFSSLSHLWADHRLSRTTKLRLYRVCVCSSLTHCCEAWTLNRTVIRSINGFNSRCLHVMTGEHYRDGNRAGIRPGVGGA